MKLTIKKLKSSLQNIDSKFWKIFFGAAIATGLILRFLNLGSAPFGIDVDEGTLISAVDNYFKTHQWHLMYYKEGETASGLVYYLLAKIQPTYRLGPTLLACLEISLFYVLLKKFFRKNLALLGVAILCLLPLHLYFSRFAGPFASVNIFQNLFLLSQTLTLGLAPQILIASLGLLWYPSFRPLLVSSLFNKHFILLRKLIVFFVSVSIVTLAFLYFKDPLKLFFLRENFHFDQFFPAGYDILNFFKMFFFTTSSDQVVSLPNGYQAPIDIGFVDASFGQPIFGWIGLPLVIFGFFRLFKDPRFSDQKWQFLFFTILTLLPLSFLGPCFSRTLIILPLSLICMVLTFEYLHKKNIKLFTILFISFLANLSIGSFKLTSRIQEKDFGYKYFNGFHRQVAEEACELKKADSGTPIFYIPIHGASSAQWMAQNTNCFSILRSPADKNSFYEILSSKKNPAFWLIIQSNLISFEKFRPFVGYESIKKEAEESFLKILESSEFFERQSSYFDNTVIAHRVKLKLKK